MTSIAGFLVRKAVQGKFLMNKLVIVTLALNRASSCGIGYCLTIVVHLLVGFDFVSCIQSFESKIKDERTKNGFCKVLHVEMCSMLLST